MGGQGADLEGYLEVGRTALRATAEAMVLSGQTDFGTILDLPCGGGRITRHLRTFFPEAALHVADIETAKQQAVAEQFRAEPFAFPHDFKGTPQRQFDLIFVGSLLTHFDRAMFERAITFFVEALAPGGIAVLTTHGRTNATDTLRSSTYAAVKEHQAAFARHVRETRAKIRTNFDTDKAIDAGFRKSGFGYFATPHHSLLYKQSYSAAFSSPSWLMQTIETRGDCLILGFKERSFGNIQDVISLQKLGR